ncbi:hypothetical protein [Streptomyces capitiformicae]|uniref:PLD phosphodiesterase domain-containing protein n=1 Tax=Streptomyces capitiformicae TaxID=2014920 RepID=A0A919L5J4_9ACTN|nr:hypothetical protein [Streptomyces capitiformicae]GHH84279.1 hypothetical protein GCM10017771_13170 [Streptomyces capitiformicae]
MDDAYADYFDTMVAKDWASWEYRTVSNGLYKAYFFPRAGNTRATDTVYSVLNNVQCTYKNSAKSSGGTAGTGEKLHTSGGPTVRCYNDDRDPLNPGQKLTTPYIIHSKYILIDGAYDGVRNKISFTGSGNYTGPRCARTTRPRDGVGLDLPPPGKAP